MRRLSARAMFAHPPVRCLCGGAPDRAATIGRGSEVERSVSSSMGDEEKTGDDVLFGEEGGERRNSSEAVVGEMEDIIIDMVCGM
jgi:hypothetical protein